MSDPINRFTESPWKNQSFNTTLKLLLAEVSQIPSEIKEGETQKESWKVLPLNATRQHSVGHVSDGTSVTH